METNRESCQTVPSNVCTMTEITTFFLNLQTDFAFKKVFGSIQNKHILIRFLNALFEGQLRVTDIKYHDKEILPSEEAGKRIVYDVYCTSDISRKDSAFFPGPQLTDGKRRRRRSTTSFLRCRTSTHPRLKRGSHTMPPR